jgi:hypothetical protein
VRDLNQRKEKLDHCVWLPTSTCKRLSSHHPDVTELICRFNAARIPTSPADIPLAYPEDTHHIVVVRNNRYFKVDTKGRGKKELAEAFREVKRMADGTPGEGVGVLCADDRDVWTEVRPFHLRF